MSLPVRIEGKIHLFGDNIDTDQIYPGRYLDLTDPEDLARHCMEGADPAFAAQFRAGDLMVAGKNFGCGSSREHAVISLKQKGVGAILAKSFARIFYRNAVNLALPVFLCPALDRIARPGEVLCVDTDTWAATNSVGESAPLEPISSYAMSIYRAGGIKPLLRARST